jgi:hypothetical protein
VGGRVMPYIDKERRNQLNPLVNYADIPKTAGELNYVITMAIKEYIAENGQSYQIFNDIIGALEGAKLEFNRRIVAPYEDKKIRENGDVY